MRYTLGCFTCEPIVTNGRPTPGLAAVIRPPSAATGADGLHIFLYDYEAICQWQATNGTDPTTREELRSEDIVPLTPPRRPLAAKGDKGVGGVGRQGVAWRGNTHWSDLGAARGGQEATKGGIGAALRQSRQPFFVSFNNLLRVF